MSATKLDTKQFIIATVLVNIWVQLSETIRYLIFVVPKLDASAHTVPEATGWVLLIWIVWGTLLSGLVVFLFWMCVTVFGNSMQTILKSTTISWAFVFVLFWVGVSNMGFSKWELLLTTLPLSWIEIFIATYIASKLYQRHLKTETI